MTADDATSPAVQSVFDRAMEEFLNRLRGGEDPDVEEYARRHPEIAKEIREVFPALRLLEVFGGVSGAGRAAGEAVPAQLGEYLVLREVGRGGMGVVYEAVQESLGRHVALKVLPPSVQRRPEHLERFRREARAAARLHHTNIVPVFGIGEQDGVHFYAMQFIRGQSLAAVLDELRRPRPVGGDRQQSSAFLSPLSSVRRGAYYQNVATLAARVADALHHAHGQGIIHRDVKPSNLLLDARGEVWVSDFGLAKVADAADLTDTGDILGTLAYMAPEQLAGRADARTDVCGLGVTLYELLTLRPAFHDEVKVRLIEKIRAEEPPPPRTLDPLIPRDLETIVLKAMAREPHLRYRSAGEMADDLRRFAEGRPITARRLSWLAQAWRWGRRKPWVAGLSAAVLLLLLTVGVLSAVGAAHLRELNADLNTSLDATRAAEANLQEKLWQSSLHRAQAGRWSNRAGRRFDSLEALADAAEIRPTPELRNEAVACLGLADAVPERTWPAEGFTGLPDLIDFTPDLRHFVRLGTEREVSVRRTQDNVQAARLPRAEREPIRSVFSGDPEGRLLAVVFRPGEPGLEVWDWRAGMSLWRGPAPQEPMALDLATDGKTLAFATPAGLHVTDTETGVTAKPRPLPGAPFAVRFCPGGTAVAVSCPSAKAVELFDAAGERVHAAAFQYEPHGLAWNPDGSLLAVGVGFDIHVIEGIPPCRTLRVLSGTRALIHDLSFHPNGNLLLSRTVSDGITRAWDVPSGAELFRFDGHAGRFAADGRTVAFRGGGKIGLWKVATGDEAPLFFDGGSPFMGTEAAAWLGEWGLMLAASHDGLTVWEVATRRQHRLPAAGPTTALAYHAGGRTLYTVTRERLYRWPVRFSDGVLRIGPPEAVGGAGKNPPAGIAVSANGSRLAVWNGGESVARLFDPTRPGSAVIGEGHFPIADLAVSPDGTRAACGHKDNGYAIWDARTGERRTIYRSGSGPVVFSPDGKSLAACRGSELALFDVETLAVRWAVPRSDTVGPMAVAFSPGGELLAYVHDRAGVRLLDPATGATLCDLAPTPPPDRISRLEFDRAGRLLAVSPYQGVRVWDLAAIRDRLAGLKLDWPGPGVPLSPALPPVRRVELDPGALAGT